MTVIYVSEAQNTNMAVQRANTVPNKLILIIQLGEYVRLRSPDSRLSMAVQHCSFLLIFILLLSLVCYPQS